MSNPRPQVVIMGAGFVGAAMGVAVAAATESGQPVFDVIVTDLPTNQGWERARAINAGEFPFVTSDERLRTTLTHCVKTQGNLSATTDAAIYADAAILIVDINLDVDFSGPTPAVNFAGFRRAIYEAALLLPIGALVIVETTVPPGTCERVVKPEIERALAERGLPADSIHLAHSYERVMPGPEYLNSITHFWRVFSGIDEASADHCEAFLRKVVATDEFPMTRLHHTTASEIGKVLENSYRATNIAFIEEWSRFAEAVGVDIYSVIDAIRMRPTHNNMRQPGFGVGGYCLVKDPALGRIAATTLFDLPELQFPFSELAIATNNRMPLASISELRQHLGGSLEGKRILLLGVSYRSDVGDTRYSPSETFYRAAVEAGATVEAFDPMVAHWDEMNLDLSDSLPAAVGFDAIVFAVAHREFAAIDLPIWAGDARPLIFDGNRVLTDEQIVHAIHHGFTLRGIGRGQLSS